MRRPYASLLTSLFIALASALALAFALEYALAVVAFAAQQSQPPQQQPPQQQAPPDQAEPETKKTKKVWTNENLQDLNGNSGVSVVGAAPAPAGNNPATPRGTGYVREKDPNWYRAQLAPLRAEIDRLDKEITKTREFINGGHTAEGQLKVNVFTVPMNPADQIAQLEKRKTGVQAKIDALEDQARRNDIPPGTIR